MAQSLKVNSGLRLEWRTERPFKERPRRSSVFSFLDADWCLEIRESNTLYNLYLMKMTAWDDSQTLEVTTWVEDKQFNREPINLQRMTPRSADEMIGSFYKPRDLKQIPEFFDTGEFTMVCMLHSVSPSGLKKESEQESIKDTLEFPTDLRGLSLDLGNLLEKGVMTDVELKCEDSTVPVHRAVLAARSEVFSAMFRNNMAESRTGVVDVPDLDMEVLQLLLKYTYCGKMEDLREDLLPRIYTAADKYAVLGLKKACSDWITGGLTFDNFICFLVLADAHSDVDFKDKIICFIAEKKEVLNSETWSRFMEEHPRLANEVYQKCVTKWFSK